jgi:hypothetical protein
MCVIWLIDFSLLVKSKMISYKCISKTEIGAIFRCISQVVGGQWCGLIAEEMEKKLISVVVTAGVWPK